MGELVMIVGLIIGFSLGAECASLEIANGDFAQALSYSWERVSAEGEVTRDPKEGRTAAGALCLRAVTGPCQAAHRQVLPIRRGSAYKLSAWVKAPEPTGAIYVRLQLLRNGVTLSTPPPARKAEGPVPDWVLVWQILDVAPTSVATHMQIMLGIEGPGTVWFDDVTLTRLPPDEPVVDGMPGDPPYGVITARDSDLFGEDGRRIRLWGVNCVDELGRDYRQITHIVRRIKAMGFNAIRLHLYDFRLIDPDARNARNEPTSRIFRKTASRGDGSLVDRLDYFIYRAEKEGLYLYLTLDRGPAAFQVGDYDVLPPATGEDEAAWKEAVAETNKGWANEHLYFVDERLGALHAEYARQQLDHRNAYTGVRIADDPYVALWELTNENGFPRIMLQGGFHDWPMYFRSALRRRWNQWLQERYGSQEQLVEAWGSLNEGESLAEGTIVPAPTAAEADRYPAARMVDFRRFTYDLTLSHCRRLESIIRESGRVSARTPISYDTIYEHQHVWYYPMSQGSFQAVGTYVGGSLDLQPDTSWLGRPPPEVYNYSYATVADKPIVVYENNIHKPAADRAYYPIFVSTFASTHDWDGVFWYVWSDGTVPDQVENGSYAPLGLRYAAPSHIWHGIVISTDEVLLASLRLGGELFTRFLVPSAPDPIIVSIGAQDLFGRSIWIGDVGVPYPEDAPGPYHRSYALAATDFVYTARYRYAPDEPVSSVSRPLIGRIPEVCSPLPGLTYDFQSGIISVDRPGAKAVVGFTGGKWDYGEGVSVEAQSVPFFCHGVVSRSDQPLERTKRALLVFTTYGENRGRVLRTNPDEVTEPVPRSAKLVARWGWGPPEIARPAVTFGLPGTFTVKGMDFSLNQLLMKRTDRVALPDGHSFFWAELNR